MQMSIKDKKLFLLDMDGTIYLGNRLFDGTLDFLNLIKNTGRRAMFLTNNSSKSLDKYVEKLNGMGIDVNREDFLSSVQATVKFLKENYGDKKIYALGTESFKKELIESGLNITDKVEDGIKCLIMGFDTELTFKKLEDACIILGDDSVDYIATNPDLVCPTEFGSVPDCGSVSIMLKNATGRYPRFIGKPQPEMINLAVEKSGFTKEETCIMGDRLYTDIASGINAGVSTIFVLSGEGTMEDVETGEWKPEFIYENIREVYNNLV